MLHETYAPFHLGDMRGRPCDEETPPFHLMFYDWNWLFSTYAPDLDAEGYMDGYYMNGPNVEGLVRAIRFASRRYPDASGTFSNSEGDTCIIQFATLEEVTDVATLAADMIKDRQKLLAAITVARNQGFED